MKVDPPMRKASSLSRKKLKSRRDDLNDSSCCSIAGLHSTGHLSLTRSFGATGKLTVDIDIPEKILLPTFWRCGSVLASRTQHENAYDQIGSQVEKNPQYFEVAHVLEIEFVELIGG